MVLRQAISDWYDGWDVDNRYAMIPRPGGQKSLSAQRAHRLVGWYLRHWQWCIGIVLTLAGLLIAAVGLW